MLKRTLLCGALAAVAATFAACGGTGTPEAGDKIFVAAPWPATGERAVYRLSDRGVDGEGQCETTTGTPEGGVLRLEERCTRDEFGDEGFVDVDATTLAPIRSERVISNSKEDKRVTHIVEYDGEVARFSTTDGEDRRETTRELPEATEEHPDPGWYDDKSLFWLIRGIQLEEGYSATYTYVINAGQPRVLPVDVRVEGKEAVDVPAGSFTAWKVRVERDNTVFFLWVNAEGNRQVVRARIESWNYELVEYSAAAQ